MKTRKFVDEMVNNRNGDQFEQKLENFFNNATPKPTTKTPENLEDILADSFVIAEKHSEISSKQLLIQNMQNLKNAGFTTIFLEHLRYDHQEALDRYLQDSNATELPEFLNEELSHHDNGWLNRSDWRKSSEGKEMWKANNLAAVIRAAKEVGIRVVGVDTEYTYDAQFDLMAEPEYRLQSMNYTAHEIIERETRDKNGKWVALVGADHAKRDVNGNRFSTVGLSELLGVPTVQVSDSAASNLIFNQDIVINDKDRGTHTIHPDVLIQHNPQQPAVNLQIPNPNLSSVIEEKSSNASTVDEIDLDAQLKNIEFLFEHLQNINNRFQKKFQPDNTQTLMQIKKSKDFIVIQQGAILHDFEDFLRKEGLIINPNFNELKIITKDFVLESGVVLDDFIKNFSAFITQTDIKMNEIAWDRTAIVAASKDFLTLVNPDLRHSLSIVEVSPNDQLRGIKMLAKISSEKINPDLLETLDRQKIKWHNQSDGIGIEITKPEDFKLLEKVLSEHQPNLLIAPLQNNANDLESKATIAEQVVFENNYASKEKDIPFSNWDDIPQATLNTKLSSNELKQSCIDGLEQTLKNDPATLNFLKAAVVNSFKTPAGTQINSQEIFAKVCKNIATCVDNFNFSPPKNPSMPPSTAKKLIGNFAGIFKNYIKQVGKEFLIPRQLEVIENLVTDFHIHAIMFPMRNVQKPVENSEANISKTPATLLEEMESKLDDILKNKIAGAGVTLSIDKESKIKIAFPAKEDARVFKQLFNNDSLTIKRSKNPDTQYKYGIHLQQQQVQSFINTFTPEQKNISPSNKVKPNAFVPTVVNFNNRSAEDQARDILKEAKRLINLGYDKVGITYSANNDQVEQQINPNYKQGNPFTGISGANQASVMAAAEKLLKNEFKDLQGKFQILPITTCAHAGGAGKVKDEWLDRDLNKIEKFMTKPGNAVIGWQNQATAANRFAIGGGVSAALSSKQSERIQETLQGLAARNPLIQAQAQSPAQQKNTITQSAVRTSWRNKIFDKTFGDLFEEFPENEKKVLQFLNNCCSFPRLGLEIMKNIPSSSANNPGSVAKAINTCVEKLERSGKSTDTLKVSDVLQVLNQQNPQLAQRSSSGNEQEPSEEEHQSPRFGQR